jgi:hypothetical protein
MEIVMQGKEQAEALNKDHILAWLDYLHAEVQGRLFDHRHGTVHPELCEPLARFMERFGVGEGVPISFVSRKTKRVEEACIRAFTEYMRAIEAVRVLTRVCFEKDGPTLKALYEEAFPGVIKAAMKEGASFSIVQIRQDIRPFGSQADNSDNDTKPE